MSINLSEYIKNYIVQQEHILKLDNVFQMIQQGRPFSDVSKFVLTCSYLPKTCNTADHADLFRQLQFAD